MIFYHFNSIPDTPAEPNASNLLAETAEQTKMIPLEIAPEEPVANIQQNTSLSLPGALSSVIEAISQKTQQTVEQTSTSSLPPTGIPPPPPGMSLPSFPTAPQSNDCSSAVPPPFPPPFDPNVGFPPMPPVGFPAGIPPPPPGMNLPPIPPFPGSDSAIPPFPGGGTLPPFPTSSQSAVPPPQQPGPMNSTSPPVIAPVASSSGPMHQTHLHQPQHQHGGYQPNHGPHHQRRPPVHHASQYRRPPGKISQYKMNR